MNHTNRDLKKMNLTIILISIGLLLAVYAVFSDKLLKDNRNQS